MTNTNIKDVNPQTQPKQPNIGGTGTFEESVLALVLPALQKETSALVNISNIYSKQDYEQAQFAAADAKSISENVIQQGNWMFYEGLAQGMISGVVGLGTMAGACNFSRSGKSELNIANKNLDGVKSYQNAIENRLQNPPESTIKEGTVTEMNSESEKAEKATLNNKRFEALKEKSEFSDIVKKKGRFTKEKRVAQKISETDKDVINKLTKEEVKELKTAFDDKAKEFTKIRDHINSKRTDNLQTQRLIVTGASGAVNGFASQAATSEMKQQQYIAQANAQSEGTAQQLSMQASNQFNAQATKIREAKEGVINTETAISNANSLAR